MRQGYLETVIVQLIMLNKAKERNKNPPVKFRAIVNATNENVI